MTEQPKISDEAIRVAAETIEDESVRHLGRDLGTVHRDDIVRAGLEAAYPLLRQQWEAEFLERLKAHGGDQWLEGYEAGCSMSHSLGCDAVEAQRDHLVAENSRLSAVVAEAIAREIEAKAGPIAINDVACVDCDERTKTAYMRAARIAREVGARAGRPNASEADDAHS